MPFAYSSCRYLSASGGASASGSYEVPIARVPSPIQALPAAGPAGDPTLAPRIARPSGGGVRPSGTAISFAPPQICLPTKGQSINIKQADSSRRTARAAWTARKKSGNLSCRPCPRPPVSGDGSSPACLILSPLRFTLTLFLSPPTRCWPFSLLRCSC